MATEQAVRSELRMHGLLPHRHTSLQVEIDRAYAAVHAATTGMDKYQVQAIIPHVHNSWCQDTVPFAAFQVQAVHAFNLRQT